MTSRLSTLPVALRAIRHLSASQCRVQTHKQSLSESSRDADALIILMLMLVEALADSLGLRRIWRSSTCVDPASVCS